MTSNLPALPGEGDKLGDIAKQHGLNDRQWLFVLEYPKDFNASAAYQRAGYKATGRVAEAAASRLLANVKVQRALAHVRARASELAAVDEAYVMQALQRNLERAMQAVEVYNKEGEPTGEWVWNGQVANKSLELLGKQLGMFGDKVEVSGGAEPIKQLTIVQHVRYEED